MIFRWSIWGQHALENLELLQYSVASFKKQFGDEHRYIVYTDNTHSVSQCLTTEAEVKRYPNENGLVFCTNSKATWRKWCPSPRLDITEHEIYVDSDVFLLKYPMEIDAFLSNPKQKFAILDEFLGKPYQHGVMSKKASTRTPFVNAGLFIQKAGHDITDELRKEFSWWKNNIQKKEHTHHDEQGALALALEKYSLNDELFVLPKDRYMLISETSNPGIENINHITLLHATYPTHPAFYKFKFFLDSLLETNN